MALTRYIEHGGSDKDVLVRIAAVKGPYSSTASNLTWSDLIVSARLVEFLELDLSSWMVFNLGRSDTFVRDSMNWDLMFAVLLWNLWLGRNAKVFDAPWLVDNSVVGSSYRLVGLMVQARAEHQLVCPPVAAMSRGLDYWEPPPAS
ncbi:hypothetical protein V6N13_042343 [Hibiscus sabdariffa]